MTPSVKEGSASKGAISTGQTRSRLSNSAILTVLVDVKRKRVHISGCRTTQPALDAVSASLH